MMRNLKQYTVLFFSLFLGLLYSICIQSNYAYADTSTITVNGATITQDPSPIYQSDTKLTLTITLPNNYSNNKNTPYYILFWDANDVSKNGWPAYYHCEQNPNAFFFGGFANLFGEGGWKHSGSCNWFESNLEGYSTLSLAPTSNGDNTAQNLTQSASNKNQYSFTINPSKFSIFDVEFKVWQGDDQTSYQNSNLIGGFIINKCNQAATGCPSAAVDQKPVAVDNSFKIYIANPRVNVVYTIWWENHEGIFNTSPIWSGRFTQSQIDQATSYKLLNGSGDLVSVKALPVQANNNDVTQTITSDEYANLPTDTQTGYKYAVLCLDQTDPSKTPLLGGLTGGSIIGVNCSEGVIPTKVYVSINSTNVPPGTLAGNNAIGTAAAWIKEESNIGFYLPCSTPAVPTPTPAPKRTKNSASAGFFALVFSSFYSFFTPASSNNSSQLAQNNQQLAFSSSTNPPELALSPPAQPTPDCTGLSPSECQLLNNPPTAAPTAESKSNANTSLVPSYGPVTVQPPLPSVPCTQVNTAIGPITTNPYKFINFVFTLFLSLSGGIALLIIIYNGYRLVLSQGNPEAVKKAREGITAGIIGIIFAILSTAILEVIGVNILQLPGFGH